MDNNQKISGKRVAFLATNGVEQSELTQPWKAVTEAGGKPELVSLTRQAIEAKKGDQPGDAFEVDATVETAKAEDYNALVMPGGVKNPDTLRQNDNAVRFVRSFFEQHKPVAAICHGPAVLIDAGVLDGRHVTSYSSLQADLENAGAKWSDEACICDQGLVTSRTPEDLDAFCSKLIEEVAEGKHEKQTA